MSNKSTDSKTHTNQEKTVRCPVDGCNGEYLARALHLHVNRSVGDGHGPQGEIPDDVDLDEAEEVGTAEVEMEYPEERDVEGVKRLCPYCKRPYSGKQGVMIHLGATAGRKNHPANGPERHDLEDFPVARVDENENVIEIIEEGTPLPATERREAQEDEEMTISAENAREHIEKLREQGLYQEAGRAEKLLFGE